MEYVNLKTHSPTGPLEKGDKPRMVTSLDIFLRQTLDICASLAARVSPIRWKQNNELEGTSI